MLYLVRPISKMIYGNTYSIRNNVRPNVILRRVRVTTFAVEKLEV